MHTKQLTILAVILLTTSKLYCQNNYLSIDNTQMRKIAFTNEKNNSAYYNGIFFSYSFLPAYENKQSTDFTELLSQLNSHPEILDAKWIESTKKLN